MTAYFRFVLRHRLLIVLACVILTGLSLFSVSQAVIASSFGKLFFGEASRYLRYLERSGEFGNNELLIIGYEDDDLLSRESLKRLKRSARKVKALPDVARVDGLHTIQRLWTEDDSLRFEHYAKAARKSPQRGAELLKELVGDGRYRGQLVAPDGRHGSVIVEFTVDESRTAEAVPGMVQTIVDLFVAEGFEVSSLHTAGLPSLMAEVIRQTRVSLETLFPATFLVLLVVVLLLFRRVSPAALAMGVSTLAVIWTMGFAALLDRQLSVFMAIVPAVILTVAFSDVIHLWSAFLTERRRGRSKEEAILASASDVGLACLLTSATTFVGFVCLSLVPTPVFRQLGIVLGLGVGVALLLAMTLVPIALSVLKPPAPRPEAERSTPDLLDRALSIFASVSTQRPWAVIAAFGVVLGLALVGIAQLKVDTDLAERMDPAVPYRLDQAYFQEHFAGTNLIELFVDAPEEGGLLDPKTFAGIAALQDELKKLPEVDHVVSLVDLVEMIHEAMGGKRRLPTTRAGLAQNLLLFEMSGGEDLDRLVDFDRTTLRLSIRLNDHSARATHAVAQRGLELGHELLGERATVEAFGLLELIGWWLDSIVEGQRNGLLLSFVVIALMMTLGLRSLRLGLGSLPANILPLLVLGGYLGFAWDQVDSDTLIIAMMALGIGVDDTIHFLMRYRLEAGRTSSRAEALRCTFAFSGRAIVLTTVVLVLGFAPFAFSEYLSTRIMGTLLPGVLAAALLADLLLVPAMVQVGALAMDGRRKEDSPPT